MSIDSNFSDDFTVLHIPSWLSFSSLLSSQPTSHTIIYPTSSVTPDDTILANSSSDTSTVSLVFPLPIIVSPLLDDVINISAISPLLLTNPGISRRFPMTTIPSDSIPNNHGMPRISSSSVSNTGMNTGSKSGIIKPKFFAFHIHVVPVLLLPKNFKDALKIPKWHMAMELEFQALLQNGT